MAQVVECPLCKYKVPSSNPRPTKKTKEDRRREESLKKKAKQ
jgi:hypothetical protein